MKNYKVRKKDGKNKNMSKYKAFFYPFNFLDHVEAKIIALSDMVLYKKEYLRQLHYKLEKVKESKGSYQIRSDQISRSVVSDSLWPHESQHARPPCPSPTPGVHSDSRASSQWCHPAISSSVVPFSSCFLKS